MLKINVKSAMFNYILFSAQEIHQIEVNTDTETEQKIHILCY